ncbi:MAG TPA: HRDC domain-containing protein, partial [Luteolibacter sp.]
MNSEMIDTAERLASHLAASRQGSAQPVCAIDTEADSLHRYRESLCLIQFADRSKCVLIDPLAIDDLSSLEAYLADATVWMHGADYDMTMFKRQFGALPAVVYDTQIGARLLGVRRFGLGDLVSHYFGVELSKSSQKADWGKRPLSPKMIEYALNDVHYLLEMGDMIVAALQEKERYEWFEESCLAARQRVLDRDDSKEEIWRVQGSGKLEPYGLACLRALWHWRDGEAKAWDRPSFMVAPNRQLLEWSLELDARKSISVPNHFRPDRVKRFHAALTAAQELPAAEWPARPSVKRRKRDRDFDRKVDTLIQAREHAAAKLDIEGSLIAPRAVLESLAAGECQAQEVLLKWQRGCLGITD